MKKRFLSLLLCLTLAACMLPTVAFAAGTDKAIQLGTSGISDPTKTTVAGRGDYYAPNSYIYFGINSTNNSTPIKWLVLDADKANDGTTSGMFLLSEYLLASGVKFNNSLSDGNTYQGSKAQSWCNSFASNTGNFSAAEQDVMLGVAKTDDAESDLYSYRWGESSITANDKLFFLSVRELADYVGNYDYAPGLLATNTAQSAGVWWLRSPHARSDYIAGVVSRDRYVIDNSVDSDWAARPAFNLNLNSVLITSAAAGGKSADGMGSGLTAVSEYTGTEWKLTLSDSSRSFKITENTVTGTSGGTVTLNYTGATVGDNEYISVILADSNGSLTHYGRVLKPTAVSGTVNIAIPEGLAVGTYTLHVFSEQYNGDYKTDYASSFQDVTLSVNKAAQTAPAKPELECRTKTSITLKEIPPNANGAKAQYRMNDGEWQDSPAFTGLSRGTEYSFSARYAETDNYAASPASAAAVFKTASSSVSAYTVTVQESKHGSVSADRRAAACGSTVTLTIQPDQGWMLETLSATDASGKELELTTVKTGEKYSFTMPAGNVTVSASFTENNTILDYFLDVSADAYYYDAVLWAVKQGITQGTDDSHFSPDGICTRAQAVTFLWRAAGSPAPKSTTMSFSDVPAGAYYYEAVQWAVENGITQGSSTTTFSPNENCSRAQIVTFLYYSEQPAGMAEAGVLQNPFTDVDMESYYGKAVLWAIANGVTTGTSATTFSPKADCTRAQIVTLLWRCLK